MSYHVEEIYMTYDPRVTERNRKWYVVMLWKCKDTSKKGRSAAYGSTLASARMASGHQLEDEVTRMLEGGPE